MATFLMQRADPFGRDDVVLSLRLLCPKGRRRGALDVLFDASSFSDRPTVTFSDMAMSIFTLFSFSPGEGGEGGEIAVRMVF